MTEPLTVEIEGRTHTEHRRADCVNGELVIAFRPAPLTLDDYTRIALQRISPRLNFDHLDQGRQEAWRAGIAAAFAAAGHPLPEGDANG